MGAWGIENFANDSALDWAAAWCESKRRDDLLLKTLADTVENGEAALAAAETVAALLGHPAADLPPEIGEITGCRKKEPNSKLVPAAIAAINAVTKDSELAKLWEETDENQSWLDYQTGLLERLKLPYQPPVEGKPKEKKAERPQLPARITLIQLIAQRFSSHRTHDFRTGGMPDLSGCTGVQINLAADFTDSERLAVAGHIARSREIELELCDPMRQRGFKLDQKVLKYFSTVRSLKLLLESLKSIEFLADYKNLEKLLVQHSSKLKELSALRQTSKLKVFGISLDSDLDLTPAIELPELRYLVLHGDGKAWDSIAKLPQIERLDISLPKSGGIKTDLSGLKSLKYLAISFRSNPVTSLETLPAITDLSLFFSELPPASVFQPLKGHPTLKRFTVGGAPGWQQLENEVCKNLGLEPADPQSWPVYFP